MSTVTLGINFKDKKKNNSGIKFINVDKTLVFYIFLYKISNINYKFKNERY